MAAVGIGALLGAGASYGSQIYGHYAEYGVVDWSAYCRDEVLIAALGGGIAGGVGFFVGPAISGIVGTGLRGSLIAGALEGILSDTLATAAMTWASGRTLTAETLAAAALGGALSGGVGGWLGWRWHTIAARARPFITNKAIYLTNLDEYEVRTILRSQGGWDEGVQVAPGYEGQPKWSKSIPPACVLRTLEGNEEHWYVSIRTTTC